MNVSLERQSIHATNIFYFVAVHNKSNFIMI